MINALYLVYYTCISFKPKDSNLSELLKSRRTSAHHVQRTRLTFRLHGVRERLVTELTADNDVINVNTDVVLVVSLRRRAIRHVVQKSITDRRRRFPSIRRLVDDGLVVRIRLVGRKCNPVVQQYQHREQRCYDW